MVAVLFRCLRKMAGLFSVETFRSLLGKCCDTIGEE